MDFRNAYRIVDSPWTIARYLQVKPWFWPWWMNLDMDFNDAALEKVAENHASRRRRKPKLLGKLPKQESLDG